MLAILVLDPDSLTSLLLFDENHRLLLDHSSLNGNMRHIWSDLALTFFADIMHLMLLWHVRSTAPMDWKSKSSASQSRRQHILYYYTQTANSLSRVNSESSLMIPELGENSNNNTNDSIANNNGHVDLLHHMRCLPDGYDGKLLFNFILSVS